MNAIDIIGALLTENAALKEEIKRLQAPAPAPQPPKPDPKSWRDLPHEREGNTIIINGERYLAAYKPMICRDCHCGIPRDGLFRFRNHEYPICRSCTEGL